MKTMFKASAILVIPILMWMIICPTLPANTPTNSMNHCQQEQQKNSSETIHVCCDQQAVSAKNVQLQDRSFVLGLAPQTVEIAADSHTPSHAVDSMFGSWKPHTLSTLSVLRI